jgi:hypothetical protein
MAERTIEERLYSLEEERVVKEFMTEFGLQLDLVEHDKTLELSQRFANNWFTSDGYFEMPFGKWGPEKEHMATSFLSFAKDPDVLPPDIPREEVDGIDWAIHLYFHRTVHFYKNEAGEECANFKARELVPLMWNGVAKWLFLDNDSTLKKLDVTLPTGEVVKEWRMHVYGLKGLNLVDNLVEKWANI